jgi:hypothetical protein
VKYQVSIDLCCCVAQSFARREQGSGGVIEDTAQLGPFGEFPLVCKTLLVLYASSIQLRSLALSRGLKIAALPSSGADCGDNCTRERCSGRNPGNNLVLCKGKYQSV